MRISALKSVAVSVLVASALSCFGSLAYAAHSDHSAVGTATRADSAPTQAVQLANDPWD